MRPLKFLLSLLIASLLLTSCNRQGDQLTGLWEFSSFGEGGDANYVDCFINLRADGKYTLFVPDYFDYGTFKQDKEDKTMYRFTSYRKKNYYGNTFWMRITTNGSEEKKITLSLMEQARQYPVTDMTIYDYIVGNVTEYTTLKKAVVQFPDEDPYSYNLNRWRMKPDHLESCKELNFRLINYMRHMQALFEGQRKAESEKTGYPYSPSPILYGANGIANKNIKDVPQYWIRTFYNEAQAIEASHMISAIFDKHMVFPNGFKRYDEMWSKLLGQMIDIARQKDFYCNGTESAPVADHADTSK